MGDQEQSERGPDRARAVLRSRVEHGAAARLHQEDTEDTGQGTGYRQQTNERFDMSDDIEKGTVGPSFDDFLKEEGRYEEATGTAVKRVLAYQLAAVMKEQRISKVEMAKRLETSRSQLDRLLDPDNDIVTLATLARAAKAVGRELKLELQ